MEFTVKGLYRVWFPGGGRAAFSKGDRRLAFSGGASPQKSCLFPLLKKVCRTKLDLTGYTPFQKKVYQTLQKIPAGKVITYAGLAKKAGYPGAARAVGTAMKKNRVPIVIPCHRVIRANGSVGLYNQGVRWKKLLLTAEKH